MNVGEPFRYSVVVPVYGNRDSLPLVVERLTELAAERDGRLEVVFVVDGSPDDSLASFPYAPDRPIDAQVLSLSRNFGSFSAIRAGMAVARGAYIAVMAADLQEPIEVVASFFDLRERDECDVVFGERVDRDDPAVSASGSKAYWWFYHRFVNKELPVGGVDVFGCTQRICREVVAFSETHTSLVGLLFWVGYRRAFVPYKRVARHSGRVVGRWAARSATCSTACTPSRTCPSSCSRSSARSASCCRSWSASSSSSRGHWGRSGSRGTRRS